MKKVEKSNEELEREAREFKPVKDPYRFNGLLNCLIIIIVLLIAVIFGSFYLVFMSGKYKVIYVDDIKQSYYEYYIDDEDYEMYCTEEDCDPEYCDPDFCDCEDCENKDCNKY